MSQDDPKELEAALTQLLAERDRRIQARLESGEVVRAPLLAVSSSEEIDAARGHAVAKLRAAGEKREIVHGDEIEVIVTGVPRCADSDRYHGGGLKEDGVELYRRQAAGYSPDISPSPEPPPPQPQRPPRPRRIVAQVRECKDGNDPGHIVEGFYDLKDGWVYVWDTSDRSPIGHAPFRPGDQVEAVARKILREKAGKHNSF